MSGEISYPAEVAEKIGAIVRAAREVCYTDPAVHRATDWGAYLATFGQRLFLLREAVDSLDLNSADPSKGSQE